MEQELKKEIQHIRKDLDFIKHVLSENLELSETAKKALKEARQTPVKDYVDFA